MAGKAAIELVIERLWNQAAGRWVEVKTLTAGTARALLSEASDEGVSTVNPSLMKAQALEILRSGIVAMPDRKPIKVGVAKNVLREVGRADVVKEVG